MSVVTYFVETAEGYLNTAAETQFGAVATTVGTILVLGTTLVVLLVFINTIYQYRAMDGRTAFWLAVKIGLIGAFATNWVNDPHMGGSYSYVPLGASQDDMDELARPVDHRLLFAGEATHATNYQTVDGAITTGIREAVRLGARVNAIAPLQVFAQAERANLDKQADAAA